MSKALAKRTYDQAIQEIGQLYDAARKTLIYVYWQIGQRIVEIEQDGAVRSEYGASLLQRFSDDLTLQLGRGYSRQNLDRMRTFYLQNPKKCSPASKLTWTHHVELLSVKSKILRIKLEKQAVKDNLGVKQIREIVKQHNNKNDVTFDSNVSNKNNTSSNKTPKLVVSTLKRPTNLKLKQYSVLDVGIGSVNDDAGRHAGLPLRKNQILIDCGFFCIRSVDERKGRPVCLPENIKPSFTYIAYIERVVDGDTLKVFIDVGFDTIVNQRLRLSHINTPELSTPEGQQAKIFVEKILKPGQMIIIKSHKTDIYGRFVADVFYLPNSSDADEIIKNGVYLNQQLLDERLAEILT